MCPEIKLNGATIALFREEVTSLDTAFGPVNLTYHIDPTDQVRQVIIDCTQAPSLGGKNRRAERVIQLSRRGDGKTSIDDHQTLEFRMGRRIVASKPNFYTRRSRGFTRSDSHYFA